MLRFDRQRVLVLAPHADDETFGCAGIIQKFRAAGSEVQVRIFSFLLGSDHRYCAEAGQYRSYRSDDRLDELRHAMHILGVDGVDIFFLDRPERRAYQHRLDAHSVGDILPRVEKCVRELNPSVILAPAVSKNQDHHFVNRLTHTLTRPYFCAASVLAYEVDGELDFRPNLFVRLDASEAQRKLRAIEAYLTQSAANRHPTSPRVQLAKMVVRGSACYADHAEAFQVIRLVGG